MASYQPDRVRQAARSGALGCAVSLLVVAGCAPEPEQDGRPARIGDCEGEDCGSTPYSPPVGRGVSEAGTDLDGGGDGQAPAGDGTLEGEIRLYDDATFGRSTVFVGGGTVGANPEGPGRVTQTFMDGSAYTLTGLPSSGLIWVDVVPEPGSTSGVLAGLHRVNVEAGTADLFLATLGTFEVIAAELVSSQSIIAERGHAVLDFVDGSGTGVEGIEITAGDVLVAYDAAGGIFRDDLPSTTGAGRVVILNHATVPIPGQSITVTYGGTASGTVGVKMARDAVSFVTIEL